MKHYLILILFTEFTADHFYYTPVVFIYFIYNLFPKPVFMFSIFYILGPSWK